MSIVKFDPQQKDPLKVFTNYEAKNNSHEDTTLTSFLKAGYYLIYCYHDLPHSTSKNEDSYFIKMDSTVRFKHKMMPVDPKQKGFLLLKQIIIQAVLDLKGAYDPGQKFQSFCNQTLKDGLGHRIVYNNSSNYWIYQEDASILKSKNMFSLTNYDQTSYSWVIPPKEIGCTLGMCIDSKKSLQFGLKAKCTTSKTKPSDYVDQKVNLADYLDASLSEVKSDSDSYYDFITLPLAEAKIQILFNKLNNGNSDIIDILSKEYPEIMTKLKSLPKTSNDSDLSWLKNDSTTFIYVGQVNSDCRREGRGALIFKSSGKVILGYFKNSQANGKGFQYGDKTLKFCDYEGEYKDGKRNGNGTLYFESGAKYVGQFVNDKREGKGTYYYQSGCKWEGNFVNNQMDGNGTYTDKNGKKTPMNYKNGKKV